MPRTRQRKRESLDGESDPGVEIRPIRDGVTRVFIPAVGGDASWLNVVGLIQQVGDVTLRTGGIQGLMTREDLRRRGHASAVLNSALRWMRREGFDTSMLYGIPNFYPRFGYAEAFPSITFTMSPADLKLPGSGTIRFGALRPDDLPALLRIYHAINAGRTGPTRRDRRTWRPFKKGAEWETRAVVRVARDGRGRPAGYVAFDSDQLIVLEVGYRAERLFPDLLGEVRRRARSTAAEQVRFHLPLDEPLMAFARPLGLREQVTYRRCGGAMVRMVDCRRALEKLAPLLATRVDGSGRLVIRTDLDDVAVRWSAGRARIGPPVRGEPGVRMPQQVLAQLIFGYGAADSPEMRPMIAGSRAARRTLAMLFPPQQTYHYDVDHF